MERRRDKTEVVRRFYDEAPFPGYPPNDTLAAFRARAERSRFAQLLDDAIPADARVVEVGCGTGQMSLYLASEEAAFVNGAVMPIDGGWTAA